MFSIESITVIVNCFEWVMSKHQWRAFCKLSGPEKCLNLKLSNTLAYYNSTLTRTKLLHITDFSHVFKQRKTNKSLKKAKDVNINYFFIFLYFLKAKMLRMYT